MTLDQIQTIGQAISEHKGYCEVPSASDSSKTYRVYVNSKLYSVSCNCKAGQSKQDCGHRLATDRYFDDRRKSAPVINSCVTCGRSTKQTICGQCLGE